MAKKSSIPIFNEAVSFISEALPDFSIASYQDKEEDLRNRMILHRHTYYELIWISEGTGIHTVDFNEYAFVGPCLFLLHPANIHQIEKKDITKGYVIKFNEQFFSNDSETDKLIVKFGIFDNILAQPVLHPSKKELSLLEDLIRKMLTEYRTINTLSNTILGAYLKIFLLEVYRLKLKHEAHNVSVLEPRFVTYQKFKQLVEEKFMDQRDVQFYANALSMSQRSLLELVQKYAGKSVSEIISDRMLLEAKRLLHHGKLSIKEIATALGFSDAAYFTRFFKKNAGAPPNSLRIKR